MKRKICYRIMEMCLVLAMIFVTLPSEEWHIFAAEHEETDVSIDSGLILNPHYADVLDAQAVEAEILELQQQNSGIAVCGLETSCATLDEATAYLKNQMVARNGSITFLLVADLCTADGLASIFEGARTHTEGCAGWEGDALEWGWKGCQYRSSSYSTDYMQVTYDITYYTDATQEAELTNAVNGAMQTLALTGASDYEKVKKIHDYICDNVNYDYTGTNDLKYTAYAAMCQGQAVCQGYAVLFYRMCKEAGLSVRVITGDGGGASHGWNIVRVDGAYYNIDCTWDGQDDITVTTYFLKSDADFVGHTRSSEYTTTQFYTDYPMATQSWSDAGSTPQGNYGINNLNASYTTVEEKSVTSTANGQPKVLIFFKTTCANSIYTLKDLCKNSYTGVDFVAIEASQASKNDTINFRNSYGNSTVTFSYASSYNNINSMWDYVYAVGMGNIVTYPMIVYIDGNNKIQYVTEGMSDAESIAASVKSYCGGTMKVDNYTGLRFEDGKWIYVKNGVIDRTKTGLVLYNDVWFYVKNGELDTTTQGFAEVNGESFWVSYGQVATTYSGLVQSGSKWFFISAGQLQKHYSGLALYDGAWFLLENGELNQGYRGLYSYDGSQFLVADGQILSNYSGLYQATDGWYFISSGQVAAYTGLVQYDGAWFYIQDGKLAESYTGYVEYDGSIFYVKNGQVVF